MPIINVSDATFAELKSLAEPFVDTPESLTARLIHEEVMRKSAGLKPQTTASPPNAIPQNPLSHENLGHTRLLSATVDGHEIYRPKWNGLMVHLHTLAWKRLGSFDALQRLSSARLRLGRFEEDGFKYLAESDFSIQGVDANLAWDHAFKLARELSIPIRALFEWRDKQGAANPGQRGLLEWSPPATARIRSPRLAHPEQARDFRKQVLEVTADARV